MGTSPLRGLFSQRLPNLLGGVSQAPETQMQPNEFKVLENIFVNPLVGLQKRPGTFHTSPLRGYASDLDNAFFHHLNYNENERYVVVVTSGDLKVYDMNSGAEMGVTFPDGKDYLFYSGDNSWRACTVGPKTYFTNREFTVKRDYESTSPVPDRAHEALVTVNATDKAQGFQVTINGHYTFWPTGDGSDWDIESYNNTGVVATKLAKGLINHPDIGPDFDIIVYGSTIYIARKNGADFNITVQDTMGNKGMSLVKGKVKSTEELPESAPAGIVVKVAGQPGTAIDDYWVVAETVSDGDRSLGQQVVWKETIAPGMPNRLDDATMPHVLEKGDFFLTWMNHKSFSSAYPFASPNIDHTVKMGWAFDQALAAKDATKTRIITDNNTGGRTALTEAHAPAGKASGTWNWTIDTSYMPVGQIARVKLELKTNTGTPLFSTTYDYPSGRFYGNQKHTVTFSTAVACYAYITLQHDIGETPGPANYPRLALIGDKYTPPGFQVDYGDRSIIQVADYNRVYPGFMNVNIVTDMGTANFTLADDATSADIAGYVASNMSSFCSTSVTPPGYNGDTWKVTAQVGGYRPLASFSGAYSLDKYRVFYSPDLKLTRHTLSGKILRNHTTGGWGTITDNTEVAIQVDALHDGFRSFFREGDEVTVDGLGINSFIFHEVDWEPRKVGTIETSPWPSIVGKEVMDVFFHKDRLGFVAENKVVMTAQGEHERLFRKTVLAVLDNDPIDIEMASRFAMSIASAVEWNGMLILSTTAGAQYSLVGTPVLSPNTVTLDLISNYANSEWMRPFTLGGSLVFSSKQGGFSQVREMFEGIYGRIETHLLTEKVPQYIVGDIYQMAGDDDMGFLACLVNDSTKRHYLYVWQYKHNQTGELLVSAWGTWFLQHTNRICSMDMFHGKLYLVTKSWPSDPSGLIGAGTPYLCLERMDLTRSPSSSEQYADRQGAVGGSVAIAAKIAFPTLYRRSAEGVPQTEGRTQVRSLKIDYKDTQYIVAQMDPNGPVAMRAIAIPGTTNTSTTLLTGSLKLPMLTENTQVTTLEIVNVTKSGFNITGIEWEAYLHSRNTRV